MNISNTPWDSESTSKKPEITPEELDAMKAQADGWEVIWKRFIDEMVTSPELKKSVCGYLIFIGCYSRHLADGFLAYLFLYWLEKPQKVIQSYDPVRGSLCTYLTNWNILGKRFNSFRCQERGHGVKKTVPLEDNYDLPSIDTQLAGVFNESLDTIMATLLENLSVYLCEEKAADANGKLVFDRNIEQASLQLYPFINNFKSCNNNSKSCNLTDSQTAVLFEALNMLFDRVSTGKAQFLSHTPADLIEQAHKKAQELYDSLCDKYASQKERTDSESRNNQKIDKKQIKNEYYRYFCPIRSPEDLIFLLSLSASTAYKIPSRYRKELLPRLAAEYRQHLEKIEAFDD